MSHFRLHFIIFCSPADFPSPPFLPSAITLSHFPYGVSTPFFPYFFFNNGGFPPVPPFFSLFLSPPLVLFLFPILPPLCHPHFSLWATRSFSISTFPFSGWILHPGLIFFFSVFFFSLFYFSFYLDSSFPFRSPLIGTFYISPLHFPSGPVHSRRLYFTPIFCYWISPHFVLSSFACLFLSVLPPFFTPSTLRYSPRFSYI